MRRLACPTRALPAHRQRPMARSRLARLAGPLLAAALLGGCSLFHMQETARGNMVDHADLQELIPGISTRADATSLLGTPTAKASFNDNEWIYIGQMTQPRVAQTTAVRKQKVVILTFDDKGVLRGLRELDGKDGQPLSMIAATTPSPGAHSSFLQEILGNIGGFNPFGGMQQNNTGIGPPMP